MEQLKNQIKNNIQLILRDFNISLLFPDSPQVHRWQNMTQEEVKKFVQDTFDVIKILEKNIDLLDVLGVQNINLINNNLIKFISQINTIKTFNPGIITIQHFGSLNQLQSLNSAFRSIGLYNQLKLIPNLQDKIIELNEASKLSIDLLQKKDDLENATNTLKTYLNTKEDVGKKAILEYFVTFQQRADEHKIHRHEKFFSFKFSGNWWWLFGMFLSGLTVFYITHSFIQDAGQNISAGQATLRISSILIPAYFTVFCAQQFIYHKNFYEVYSFKEVAVNTMNRLRNTVADERVKEKILDKGLEVMFSNPISKDNKGGDKQIISELMSMLKNQLDGK